MDLDRLIDELATEAPGIQRGVVARAAKAGYLLAIPRRKQATGGLQWLQDDMAKKAGRLTARLGAGEIDQATWEKGMQSLIARYQTSALMLGQGSDEIDEKAASILLNMTDDQFAYLANFGAEIASAAEWQEGYQARAESYAGAIKEPYWTGEVDFLPLPAMPAQGTQCRCLSDPASLILTARGEIPIVSVRAGDLVLTHRMRWRPVLRTIVTGSLPHHRQAYLHVSGRRPIACTADHRFLTERGWEAASSIANSALSVYNREDEELRPMRKADGEQSRQRNLPGLSGGLPLSLRRAQGSEGQGVPLVRDERQGDTPMAEAICREKDAITPEEVGNCAALSLRGPRQGPMGTPRGWSALGRFLVRGRPDPSHDLSLSVDLDRGQWTHPSGNGHSSQERRSYGRPAGEPGADGLRRSSASPHDRRTQAEDGHGERSSVGWDPPRLPALPEGISFRAVKAEVLLDGLLSVGTPLYDLEVAEDHSFVVEGMIAHNSNCGCSWRIEVVDDEAGDYDAYWERSKDDSCATCLEREAQWSPVRIRGGLLE